MIRFAICLADRFRDYTTVRRLADDRRVRPCPLQPRYDPTRSRAFPAIGSSVAASSRPGVLFSAFVSHGPALCHTALPSGFHVPQASRIFSASERRHTRTAGEDRWRKHGRATHACVRVDGVAQIDVTLRRRVVRCSAVRRFWCCSCWWSGARLRRERRERGDYRHVVRTWRLRDRDWEVGET